MDQIIKLVPEGIELIGDMEDDVVNALYNKVLGLRNILHGLVKLTNTSIDITDAGSDVIKAIRNAGLIVLLGDRGTRSFSTRFRDRNKTDREPSS